MRICLLSDVHANAYALRAVLDDATEIDRFVHAGDVVGYNPFPGETIDLFDHAPIDSIRGNHDRALIDEAEKDRFLAQSSDAAAASLSWTDRQIADEERTFLADLPSELELLDGLIRVVHGSPRDPNEYIYPDDAAPDLLGTERVLVHGHTHVQYQRSFDNGIVVNPGSVGQPRDGTAARYAVLDTESWDISLKRVPYDREPVISEIKGTDLPERTIELLDATDK